MGITNSTPVDTPGKFLRVTGGAEKDPLPTTSSPGGRALSGEGQAKTQNVETPGAFFRSVSPVGRPAPISTTRITKDSDTLLEKPGSGRKARSQQSTDGSGCLSSDESGSESPAPVPVRTSSGLSRWSGKSGRSSKSSDTTPDTAGKFFKMCSETGDLERSHKSKKSTSKPDTPGQFFRKIRSGSEPPSPMAPKGPSKTS
eukprot:TRINITY_DN65060_c0_g1_i1.p1 TRINITY_DN65060_c0_g1~~TRINITY_DN65060_c0_g1_i1.p1  ORF type:complete len:223 (-),score=28.24 TRINITY_DN65060_c0_g1_i1:192-791(-)